MDGAQSIQRQTSTLPVGPRAGRAAAPSVDGALPRGHEASVVMGSDGAPSLWEMLTPEEREFFVLHQGMGALTYRPDGRPGSMPPVPTGGRIDVRG